MEYQIKPTGTWMDKVNGNWLDPSNINYISENYSNNLRTQNALDNHIIEDGWNKDSDGKYRKNVYTTDDRFLDFNDTFKILNPLIDSTTFLANSIKDSKENKEFNRKRNASTFNYNYNPNEEGINNIPVYYKNGGNSKKWLDETIGDYKWLDNINDTGYLSGSDTEQNRYNIIPSNVITMKGVDYPIYGVDDLGNEKIMFPENDYLFEGNFVYEKPIN